MNISVKFYNLENQLVVSPFENVFFKSAVLKGRLLETLNLLFFVCLIKYCKRKLRFF